ncbi:Angiotensin-converting enzyme [Sarcoptes scabiei]|uniref:Angiotensin-converting enzyme n=1 Tax=Sarcoptes scabiei TaxID=52283 RepID=A0A834REN2_SARSC|nr:Angiotensin-converting enzyme [Sarcoptes scabiei]
MRRRRRKKMMMPIVRLSSTIISLIIWYYGIVSFVTLDHLIGSIHAVSSETKHHQNCATIFDEKVAKIFIEQVNEKLEKLNYEIVETSWRFNTDITEENQEALLEATSRFNREQKNIWRQIGLFDYSNFTDPLLRRQFQKLSVLGVAALDENESQKFTNITTEMEKIYSSTTVCIADKCNLELDPDLTTILAKSRDFDHLKNVWHQWRNESARPIRDLYKEYIALGNKAAKLNGFRTLDDLWLFPWETPDFKHQILELWNQIEPYYKKLHAYVRLRLRKYYGERMPKDGTIPAHILGNMWAQSWSNIFDLVAPYPGKSLDVTETLKEQNYTALEMFKLSEQFFTDLDRKVVCHASAWDFYNRKDFRIKMCTSITMQELITIHHEMGHIQYYLQYKDQPITFREGANPGFHEAVGDLLALSVSTPEHLTKIRLLAEDSICDEKLTLNYQMHMALDKIAFLPFAYLMDAYRWDLFSGKVSLDRMNEHWWWYRLQFQGISPPNKRSEEDFDAGAKYHIPASVEYIRYFVSFIIQFQFHKALCEIAQPDVPLYRCDIDGSVESGKRLAEMLALGSSVKWPTAMKLITGSEKMSAAPLIEYFQPLFDYIDEQLCNETIGWNFDLNDYFDFGDALGKQAEKLSHQAATI